MIGGHLENIALRKANAKPDERVVRWRGVGDDNVLEIGRLTIGKRGARKWHKPFREVVVTKAEIEAEQRTYEVTTGHCHHCFGKRQEVAGVSAQDGPRYRPCRRCGGSGKAPGSP